MDSANDANKIRSDFAEMYENQRDVFRKRGLLKASKQGNTGKKRQKGPA
jgi:hypothetical protein